MEQLQFSPLLDHLDDYLTLGLREFTAAAIRPFDRILLLGSGPLPMTGIVYVLLDALKHTGAFDSLGMIAARLGDDVESSEQIIRALKDLRLTSRQVTISLVGLDRNPEAVALAGELVARVGLSSLFDFTTGDAAEFVSEDPFDVIHVAAMVSDRAQVVRQCMRLVRLWNKPATIIVRYVPHGDLREALYTPWSLDDLQSVVEENPGLRLSGLFQPSRTSKVWTGFATFTAHPEAFENFV